MKFLKPHKYYGNCMSESYKILKLKNVFWDIQEHWGSLHWIDIRKWKRNEDNLFVWINTIRIPLNREAYKILKLIKKENKNENR